MPLPPRLPGPLDGIKDLLPEMPAHLDLLSADDDPRATAQDGLDAFDDEAPGGPE